ncbi:hypothetical protein DMN91_000412 [Ooceraea biroi]|uniref:Uncharacterized protein n=1 Tax=Ooceraea biroi TaxID=2015173 RepID=A0A3L8E1V6_OOCBI|nr:hypothetical protein DMN91_000412 [Ooceraea biroi]
MIARLPTVTHSTVWRIPVSDYEPLPRVWSCPPIFNDRETAHGDAFNGLAHSSLGLRTITTSLVLFTDHLMIARLSMPMRFWRISVSDYELLPRSQTTNHYHEFGPVHRLLMIARLPTVTHSTVWRIPVSDYEPLPRVWSCPPTFNDGETAHGDAFNGLAHSSLRLRTITTSLVLSTDLLMIARLPTETHSTVWRIPVSDYEPLPRSQTTNHYHEFGPVHRLLMIARLPTETHSTVWSIPVSDYEPLPRVWSCPPTFNDRETAHGDAFNGLAHSSLRLRTITTSLVLSTDF